MPFGKRRTRHSFRGLLASAALYEASSFSTAASRSLRSSTSASRPPTAPASRAILRLRLLARLDNSPSSAAALGAAAAGCPCADGAGGVGLDVVAAEEVVAVEVEGVAVFVPEKAAVLAVVVVSAKATVLVDAVPVVVAAVDRVVADGLDEAVGLVPGEGPGWVPPEGVEVRAGLPEGTDNLSFPPSELPPGVLRKGQSSHLTFWVDHFQLSPLAGSVAWRVNQKTSPWTAVSWERVLGLYSLIGVTFFSAKISRTVSSLVFGFSAAAAVAVAVGAGSSFASPRRYWRLPSGAPRRR